MIDENAPSSLETESLRLVAESHEEVARFTAVVALGMCRALEAGVLSPAYACDRFFSPALLKRLERMGMPPSLCGAIHLATELEDVSEIVSDSMSQSLAEIERELVLVLRELSSAKMDCRRWLDKINAPVDTLASLPREDDNTVAPDEPHQT